MSASSPKSSYGFSLSVTLIGKICLTPQAAQTVAVLARRGFSVSTKVFIASPSYKRNDLGLRVKKSWV